jgi:iron(III) transport system permease protein
VTEALRSAPSRRTLRVSAAWLPALAALLAFLTLPFGRPRRPFLDLDYSLAPWQLGSLPLWLVGALALAALVLALLPLATAPRGDAIAAAGAAGLVLGAGWLIATSIPFGVGALLTLTLLVLVTGTGLSEGGRVQGDAFVASSILFVSIFVVLFIVYPISMVLRAAFILDGALDLTQMQRTLRHPLFFFLENPRSAIDELALTYRWAWGGLALGALTVAARLRAARARPIANVPRFVLWALFRVALGFGLGFLVGVMLYGRGALPTSLLVVSIVAPTCTLLGLGFAFLGQRARFAPVRASLNVISVLPIITPPFILAFAMIFLLGRRGIITHGLFDMNSNWIYGPSGVALAQILAFTPIAYLLLRGSLASLDPALEEAAQTLGANRWRTLRTITWPLVRPGLAAAFLLSMIESLADFGNPLILGGGRNYLATEVYLSLTGRYNPREAAAYGVVLLMLVLFAFFLQRWWMGGGSFVTVTGKPSSGRVGYMPGPLEAFLTTVMVIWTVFVFGLYGSIVYGSFTQLWGVNYTLTLQHYRDFSVAGWPVFLYTARVAAISAVPAMLLGFLIAYLVVRHRFLGRRFVEFGSLLSFATPGTVMGVAYIFAFNTGPWLLTATATIIVLALVFRNMPVAIRAAVAGLAQIDPSLEEASTMLRARTFTTMRRVLFPLLVNTLVTGLIFAFVSAMTAVSQVIFLTSPGNNLATVLLLGWIDQGLLGRGAAMGTVLIVSMLFAIVVVLGIARRIGRRMIGVES